ncbi:ATP-dependent Lhr-like helicase [Nocardiopsis mwathae]|uniref:ATP-dependent Lhr-like helicase n=1 Tax=Nocardiopsis mwathae TaxID=1472723 RepID=A0A7W9YEV0_9ACTN|nr:DEAD/DEAH box helicase [Nocardiopsis mwathae]MBB6170789.1 ATP-dependent Lhr-like helicase [Nocardiopsis mwathae]
MSSDSPGTGRRAALDRFSPATRTWFAAAFPAGATPAQTGAWEAISGGGNTLVIAPTGSGKTLAAFLWALDGLATAAERPTDRSRRCRVLYVSPLKALAADIQRNLRVPLSGIRSEAARRGEQVPDISVGVRTGDTPAAERRKLATAPPDILITTPESLFLILTSQARSGLCGVETVIVDEVHALAGTKRGAHLALSLERLDALLDRPAQRIGLSATVRPAEEVASFLGGARPAAVVHPPDRPRLDLRISVPVEDMANPEAGVDPSRADDTAAKARTSIWPHVESQVLDLVERHRSTIVFTNSRRIAERLCTRLNELATERRADEGAEPSVATAEGTTTPTAQTTEKANASNHTQRRADEGAEPSVATAEGTTTPTAQTTEKANASNHTQRRADEGAEPSVATAEGTTTPTAQTTEKANASNHTQRRADEGAEPSVATAEGTTTPTAQTTEKANASDHTQRRADEGAEPRNGPDVFPPHARPAEVAGQSGQSRGADRVVARAHHGSVSKGERAVIEGELKAGRLPCVVATSSLELGIDMGAVDLVVQVESPPSVASGLQRVGRAGHHVDEVSRGVLVPQYRGDLPAATVVAERMRSGEIEELRMPRNPLDVLAQQVVAMAAMEEWAVADIAALARRAAPFAALPDSALSGVLDMLSGRYPSDEFAGLRPRLVWDREEGTVTARPGAQRLAVVSGGTIPDRGLYPVYLVDAPGSADGPAPDSGARRARGAGPSRVGELEEEMVYESRVGDVFVLGASSWRIERITADRVLVSPAPGRPGRLPFWNADALGRPLELGRAIGALLRELGGLGRAAALERARAAGLDGWAAANLVAYLEEQREATGHVPDDRTIVVERFRDELGDWRLVVHSPLGARVNAPWALVLGARLRNRYGLDPEVVHDDDGIVLRLPDVEEPADRSGRAHRSGVLPELLTLDPEATESAVTAEIGSSALFAARFRECASRALLLPRHRPGRRMPLWQQRLRSAQLLAVAAKFGSFPIVLETVRECLRDVFDVPGLAELMSDIAARRVRIVEVETRQASPFAQSLLLGYTAAFLYEGDAPLAELKAQALTLDSALLADLIGQAHLRELLDPGVVAEVEAQLQRLAGDRRVRPEGGVEGMADLLRELGPLTSAEARERTADTGSGADPGAWLAELEERRRAVRVRVAGVERWAAVEDAARLRDALGVELPAWLARPGGGADTAFAGTAAAFTAPVPDPLGDLLSRHARTHGPFTADGVAARFGLGRSVVRDALRRLGAEGRILEGEFRPGGRGTEWCDAEVLRRLRRRSIARLRREVEPVAQRALARFVPAWQHVGPVTAEVGGGASARPRPAGRRRLHGPDAVFTAVESLRGAPVPASALESLVLPARVEAYAPALLDELTQAGEVVWAGAGAIAAGSGRGGSRGGSDGWVCLVPADEAETLLPERLDADFSPLHGAVLEALRDGGALFFRDIADRVMRREGVAAVSDAGLVAALWDLAWAGWITNDTLAPLRSLLGAGGTAHRGRSRRPVLPTRTGPPTVAGRWSVLRDREGDPTLRGHAGVAALLDRYGVVTRGPVVAEQERRGERRRDGGRGAGGFSAVYPVLRAFEDAGKARRGYFVEGLGAAQFALPGAVDRLRSFGPEPDGAGGAGPAAEPALVLAAADPANVYGAALPWPETPEAGARPGRKAGALVVLDGGELTLYLERGGRTVLTFGSGEAVLARAAAAVADLVRAGHLSALTVERADGQPVFGTPLDTALTAAGFHPTPKGLRLR